MNEPNSKVKMTAKLASKLVPAQMQAAHPANAYLMSPQAAGEAVRRAGIVTPSGKLSRIYK